MKTKEFLKEHSACKAGAKWALSIGGDMVDVWEAMIEQGNHAWLLWTATKPGVFPDSVLRNLACRFVRETPLADGRKIWDLLTDERSRRAVEVAELYANGKATDGELQAAYAAADAAYAANSAAREAAYTAAHAAAHAAARDAAYGATDAAYGATDAAHAAARAAARAAAYAAYDANAARAAAYAAYDANVATDAAACAAYDAANAAQVQMIAELGNPFK
jgi:hypothetical protein